MSYPSTTEHYHLPQYSNIDNAEINAPSWVSDITPAFATIDTSIYNNQNNIASNLTEINTLKSSIQDNTTDISTVMGEVAEIKTDYLKLPVTISSENMINSSNTSGTITIKFIPQINLYSIFGKLNISNYIDNQDFVIGTIPSTFSLPQYIYLNNAGTIYHQSRKISINTILQIKADNTMVIRPYYDIGNGSYEFRLSTTFITDIIKYTPSV